METPSLWDKIKLLLGSLRFWILTLGAVAAILEQYAAGTATLAGNFEVVKVWFAAVAALGTFDSIASRLAGSKS